MKVNSLKKYICECIGTAVLVLFGCGAAIFTGSQLGADIIAISLAFGLSIIAMAYVIGNISGCHVNPAVSLAMLINKKLTLKDFIGYVIAQILGAFIGAALLFFILTQSTALINTAKSMEAVNATGETEEVVQRSDFEYVVKYIADEENGLSLGTNGFGDQSGIKIKATGAIVVEIILTFVFVYTILGVTSNEKYSSISGIVIGLTLAFVHILGISLTGTSVNPARSLGPATMMAILGNTTAIKQVWVFIVAPLVGSALASLTYMFLNKEKSKSE